MVTVSATVTQKMCGMASIRRHTWVAPFIKSTHALTSSIHWCARRKSTPIITGTSMSATTISCGQSPSQVPKLKPNDTRPKELVTLPSAKWILPVWPLWGTLTFLEIMATIDGWITLIVDPVSTKPITSTPPIFMGRYKLPVSSDSNSTSSLIGPSTSSAADSLAWVAATAGFPKMFEFHLQCSEHYHLLLSALLSAEPANPLDLHERVHERDTV